MTLSLWLAYVATVLALMSTPGPSHMLMISNSIAYGARRSAATAVGDLMANVLQMLAAGLGLAALIAQSGTVLSVIKWAGVAYLLWLGLTKLRQAGQGKMPQAGETRSPKALWMQGFVTSAANPKAVVFFAALFPQFLDPSLPFWPQFLILSLTYLAMDGAFLVTYGLAADRLATRLQGRARLWLDKAGGVFMIVAALLLAARDVKLQ